MRIGCEFRAEPELETLPDPSEIVEGPFGNTDFLFLTFLTLNGIIRDSIVFKTSETTPLAHANMHAAFFL